MAQLYAGAVAEDGWWSRAPILVVDLRAVLGGHRAHGGAPSRELSLGAPPRISPT